MSNPLALRDDYDDAVLRRLAAIYGGASCGEAVLLAGTDRQSIRNWVLRFNAGGPDGLVDRRRGAQSAPDIRDAGGPEGSH